MSIKRLFNSKPSIMTSPNSSSAKVESPDYVESVIKDRETYIPPIDFSRPEQFIRFGLAKEYYGESIKRIYNSYPYDGSEKEKKEFLLNSSYLDRWMLENKYPRYSGYAKFAYDSHIVVNRGYKGATDPNYTKLNKLFDSKNTTYESAKRRKQTFTFNLSDGITVEWWMNRSTWNNATETFLELSSSNLKLDLILSNTNNPIQLSASSTNVISTVNLGAATLLSSSVGDGSWHHYALTLANNNTNTETHLYVDGVLNNSITSHNKLSNVDELVTGFIGSGSFGLLSASVNEFRYWNKKQTSESIYYNYNRNIGGGATTDDYRKELGVYYRFNEGVTTTTSIDRIALDYSGRISNGYWENYVATSRQSGSSFLADAADPIMRSTDPLVTALVTEMETSGSNHDRNNSMQMYNMVHSWIRDEDEGSNQGAKKLVQILSSYFDTLYSQIEYLPDLRAKRYFDSSQKPLPFANKLLEEKGIIIPEVLINKDVLEYFGNRDSNNKTYEKDFEEVKNLIYYNIYNNIDFILKSKGTEKAYRNFLRCFGIDDEVVKLNVYTDNATSYLIDKTKHTSVKTKTIDFFGKNRLGGTVYQENTVSGSMDLKLERNSALTAETSLIVAKKIDVLDTNFFPINFLTASVFGVDSTTANGLEYSPEGRFDSFEVVLARTLADTNSPDAKWMLRLRNHASGTVSAILTSSVFQDIYENNELWNVAVRIYPEGYPFAGSFATGSQGNYKIDFYGVTHAFDEVKDSFSLSTTVSYATGSNLLSARKRAFIGSRRTNWSGSVVNYSDVKVNSFRLYYDKLENSTINQHNKDPFNYGQTKVFGNPTPFNYSIDNIAVPGAQSLAINWDFQTVTSSNAAGTFNVEDFSSGSTLGRYGWLENVTATEHRGVGFGFPASSTNVVNNEYIFASKKELPEISFTADNIQIMGQVQELLSDDDDVTDNLFAMEKSMYQVVSEEMMNMFSTMSEYSNLFIKPVDRYRADYKRLSHIRQLFFERVSGSMDLETFTNYYKWIDGAISQFLNQLHPAMSKFSPGISDMVESHILERPKYTHKFGFVRTKGQEEGVVKGVNELTYNWKFGHSPEYKSGGDNDHCLWQKERKELTAARAKIQSAIVTHTTGNIPEFGDNNSDPYAGSAYALKRFSKPYNFGGQEQKTIFGGINYERTKDRDLLKTVTQVHGPKSNIGIPTDVVVLGVGEGLGIETVDSCQDVEGSANEKRKYGTGAIIGRFSNFDGSSPISGSGLREPTAEYNYRLKGQRIFPFNLMSGSEPTGYNKKINDSYTNNAILTNLHSDTTSPSNEIPMQGPFTQTWVGGRQSRHVSLNRGVDGESTRPEEYRILIGDHPDEAVKDGALGMTGPDYGGPYPDTTRPWAIHYRDERAKRPVNVANRKRTSQTEGNYAENYEIVSVVGRKENNLKFREFESTTNFLPSDIKNILPETTHPMTLIGVSTNTTGNVFGQGETTNINATREIIIPGTVAKGAFEITGATLYKAPYSASIEIQPIPVAAKHSFLSWKLNVTSGSSDGNFLHLTGGATQVKVELDFDGTTDSETDVVLPCYRKALKSTSGTYDSISGSYSGLGANDFSLSFWFNNTNADATTHGGSIHFLEGASFRHNVYLRDDFKQGLEATDNDNNYTIHETNTATYANEWMHYVITFPVSDLTTGNPQVYQDGEIVSRGSYSPPNGTTPTIDGLVVRLDNLIALQDLILWDKILDQNEARALYNSGSWFNPSTFVSASNIIDWFKFGEEQSFNDTGYVVGNSLNSINPSDSKNIESSYGSGDNVLTLDQNADDNYTFLIGVGTADADVIYDRLTSSLNTEFSGWNTSYVSSSTGGQFFLRNNNIGSNIVGISETGNSFSSLAHGSGSTAVSSLLQDKDTLTIGTDVLTIGHTTSGSGDLNINTAQTYRKSLQWKTTSTQQVWAGNTSYTTGSDGSISFSFWYRPDVMTSADGGIRYILYAGQNAANSSIQVWRGTTSLGITLSNTSAGLKQWSYNNFFPSQKWEHVVVKVDKSNIHTEPLVYRNGSLFSSTSVAGSGGALALREVTHLYLGDPSIANAWYESEGDIQDFAVWNKALTVDDSRVLYNSGSWFDIHGHASASYVTDWWLLGNESNIGQASGSALSAGSAVTSISPTIGSHNLTFNSNANVFVTDGIAETLKTNLDFWVETTASLLANTIINSIPTTAYSNQYQLTAATANRADDSAITLSKTGNGFSLISAFARGADVVTQQRFSNAGANDGDYLQIGSTTRFIIDIDGGTSGTSPGYQKSGDHWYIYSSGATNNLFWNRIYKAIDTQFPLYTINTSSINSNLHFFQITSSVTGTVQNRTLTESGNSYFSVQGVTGATNATLEQGYINVTQVEPDYIEGTTRQKTIIASRFSAPGGPEVQTYGFLDAYAHEYSVHNAITYRNLSVRGDSGETGTIRVNSPASRREGLNTLQRRHCGKFGIDSTHGAVSSTDYVAEASFHKIHRNSTTRPEITLQNVVTSKALRMPSDIDSQTGILSGDVQSTYPSSGYLSFSFWFKQDVAIPGDYSKYIFEADDNSNNNAFLVRIVNNKLVVALYDAEGDISIFQSTNPINNINLWNHFVVVVNLNDVDSIPIYYLNGQAVDVTFFSNPAASSGAVRAIAGRLALMGNDADNAFSELQGSLQEFAFYNTEISAVQALSIYQSIDLTSASTYKSNIIDYWRLGEEAEFDSYNYGDSVADGLSFNATIGSTVLTIDQNIFIEPGRNIGTVDVDLGIKNNNFYVQTTLPQSDYNYSWISSSLGSNYSVRSGTQKVFGYWPKNGTNKVNGVFDSAITFPTASQIQGR